MTEHFHTPSGRTSPLSDEEEMRFQDSRKYNLRPENDEIRRTRLSPPTTSSSRRNEDPPNHPHESSIPNFLPPGSKVFKARCQCGGHHFLFSIPKEANYSKLLSERKNMEDSIQRLRQQAAVAKEQRHSQDDLSQREVRKTSEDLQIARDEIDSLKAKLKVSEDRNAEFSRQVGEERGKNSRLTDKFQDLEAKYLSMRQNSDNNDHRIQLFNDEIDGLKSRIGKLNNQLDKEKSERGKADLVSEQLEDKMKERKKQMEVIVSQLRAYEKKCRECEVENKNLFSQIALLKGSKNKEVEDVLNLKKREMDERQRRSIEEVDKVSRKNQELERRNRALEKELDNHRRTQARELQEAMRVARKGQEGLRMSSGKRGHPRKSGLISREEMRAKRLRGKDHNKSMAKSDILSSTTSSRRRRPVSTGRQRPGSQNTSRGFLYSSFRSGASTTMRASEIDGKNRSMWAELKATIQNLVVRNVQLAKQLMQITHQKNKEAEKWQKEYEKIKDNLVSKMNELTRLRTIAEKYSKVQKRISTYQSRDGDREAGLTKVRAQLEDWKARANELERQKSESDQELKKKEAQLTSVKREKRAMIIREKGEKEKMDKKMKGLTARVMRLAKFEKDCRELKESVREKSRRIDQLENEIIKLEMTSISSSRVGNGPTTPSKSSKGSKGSGSSSKTRKKKKGDEV